MQSAKLNKSGAILLGVIVGLILIAALTCPLPAQGEWFGKGKAEDTATSATVEAAMAAKQLEYKAQLEEVEKRIAKEMVVAHRLRGAISAGGEYWQAIQDGVSSQTLTAKKIQPGYRDQ